MEVIAYSGGKDSTAMALLLEEREPNPDRLFLYTPTGNELPPMKLHMDLMMQRFGRERFVLPAAPELVPLIRQKQCIPNWRMRWCTILIKIEPCLTFLHSLKEKPTLCVGLRADEPMRTGLYDEAVTVRHPLWEYDFGLREVYQIIEQYGIVIPVRTDCAFCYYQRLIDWWRLWQDYPELYAEAEQLEQEIGHTFRSESKDNHPTSLTDLWFRFASGWIPKYRKRLGESRGGCRICSM
jgi:hypothetical protein